MEETLGNTKQPFLKRHDRSVAVLGALLVFATFLVKDSLKEGVKGRMESVEAAKTVFAIREDLKSISESIDKLDTKIVNDTAESEHKSQIDQLLTSVHRMLQLERLVLGRIRPGLSLYADLAEKLPNSAQRLNQIKALKGHLNAAQSKDDNLLSRLDAVRRGDNAGKRMVGIGVMRDWHGSGDLFLKTELEDVDLRQALIADAEKSLRQSQERYHWFSWASYGLYIIGWGLSLAGKLFGGDSAIESL